MRLMNRYLIKDSNDSTADKILTIKASRASALYACEAIALAGISGI